ncbi:MAG: hypothetical protein WDM84_00830 [Bauldia sp.]
MDPGHIAFVHTSKWYRSKAGVVKPKEKSFAPSELGFRMLRHKVTAQNLIYRLLGRNVTTEISYRLPGLRIEGRPRRAERAGDGERADADQRGGDGLPPDHLGDAEVGGPGHADRALRRQRLRRPGPRHRPEAARRAVRAPKTMLINDVNTQARWWMRLKDEWVAAGNEGRDFVNPLKAATLRWKS